MFFYLCNAHKQSRSLLCLSEADGLSNGDVYTESAASSQVPAVAAMAAWVTRQRLAGTRTARALTLNHNPSTVDWHARARRQREPSFLFNDLRCRHTKAVIFRCVAGATVPTTTARAQQSFQLQRGRLVCANCILKSKYLKEVTMSQRQIIQGELLLQLASQKRWRTLLFRHFDLLFIVQSLSSTRNPECSLSKPSLIWQPDRRI